MKDDKVSTALAVDKYMHRDRKSPSPDYAEGLKALNRDYGKGSRKGQRRPDYRYDSRRGSSKT